MKVNFHMERLIVSIKDDKDKNEIIRLTVGELMSTLTQRPGAQAIKFVTTFCFFVGVHFNGVSTVTFKETFNDFSNEKKQVVFFFFF